MQTSVILKHQRHWRHLSPGIPETQETLEQLKPKGDDMQYMLAALL